MKFQKRGKNENSKKSFEIPKMLEKMGIPKKTCEIPNNEGKKLEFVDFSSIGPASNHLLINFEKILCSKETSCQNSKNHMT